MENIVCPALHCMLDNYDPMTYYTRSVVVCDPPCAGFWSRHNS